MKPYNIEIFDRNFNFIYNALVDESDFSYSYDAISPVKNTIPITKDFKPSELSSDVYAPRGWYIRIIGNDGEYQGIISGFEEGDTNSTITYTQLSSLFDFNTWVETQKVTTMGIESYIASVLTDTFINNSDPLQKITGLQISYTGNTQGALDYCNTDSAIVGINIASDLIVAAYNTYGIYTDISADFGSKNLNVSIGILDHASRYIEGDLPNIIESEFTIKKSSNIEINKVTIKDTYTQTETSYYLYDDGTFGTDANPTGKSRISPVNQKIIIVSLYDIAKSNVDAKYNDMIETVSMYAVKSGTLTDAEYNALNSACNVLANFYLSYISNPSYSFNKIYTSDFSGTPGIYDFSPTSGVAIEARGKIVQKQETAPSGYPIYGGIDGKFGNYGSSIASIGYGTRYNRQYNFYAHAAIYYQFTVSGTYTDGYSTITGSINDTDCIPFDLSAANKAVSAYKNTAEYQAEIADAIRSASTQESVRAKAVAEFAKNKYSNLIELTVKADDTMINPMDLEIGQTVNIIHEGVSYNSILSGKEIKGGLVKLIFGTIRLELTKILNMKGV